MTKVAAKGGNSTVQGTNTAGTTHAVTTQAKPSGEKGKPGKDPKSAERADSKSDLKMEDDEDDGDDDYNDDDDGEEEEEEEKEKDDETDM